MEIWIWTFFSDIFFFVLIQFQENLILAGYRNDVFCNKNRGQMVTTDIFGLRGFVFMGASFFENWEPVFKNWLPIISKISQFQKIGSQFWKNDLFKK